MAILPGLIAKGPVPATDFEFAPAHNRQTVVGWSFWGIVPVGQRKKDFDSLPGDEVPSPICGDLGYAADYIGFFMISDSHPQRVLHVNLGQDGTMFDPFSVRFYWLYGPSPRCRTRAPQPSKSWPRPLRCTTLPERRWASERQDKRD